MLLKASGTDATSQFDAFHNRAVLDKLGAKFLIGKVGTGEPEAAAAAAAAADEEDEKSPLQIGETFGDMVPFGDPMW